MSTIKIISYIINNKYIFNNHNKLIKNIIYNTELNKLNKVIKDSESMVFFNNNKDIYNYYKKIVLHKTNELNLKKYDGKLKKDL